LKKKKISTDDPNTSKLVELLESLGMIPLHSGVFKFKTDSKKHKAYLYEVVLDGRPLGYVDSAEVESMAERLRYLKALANCPIEMQKKSEHFSLLPGLPKFMEICHVPRKELENCSYTMYPGLYLFTSPGRMMRPVKNLSTNNVEYIGTMEQCFLHVCIKPDGFIENVIVDII
jgi:DNA-directed RNA polymerase I subunit RPA2